jgi:hypothetical protein
VHTYVYDDEDEDDPKSIMQMQRCCDCIVMIMLRMMSLALSQFAPFHFSPYFFLANVSSCHEYSNIYSFSSIVRCTLTCQLKAKRGPKVHTGTNMPIFQ